MRCIYLILFLLIGPSIAEADESTLDRAEAAFRQGIESRARFLKARQHFSDATDSYLKLQRDGVRSSALYRSLGNAAYLADRWPEAIWAYRAGLHLDPNDRAMRENLAVARSMAKYPPTGVGRPENEDWPLWLRRPTNGQLMVVFVLLYAAAWMTALLAFIRQSHRLTVITIVIVVAAFADGAAWWFERQQMRMTRNSPVVVMASDADFYRGNGPSYPKHPIVPLLPRGLEARQTHRRGDWLQIRLTTGEIGWVHVAQVLIVEP